MKMHLVNLARASLDLTSNNLETFSRQSFDTVVVSRVVQANGTRSMRSLSVSTRAASTPKVTDRRNVFIGPSGKVINVFSRGLRSIVLTT
jgi:hypothetical protein